MSSTLRAFAVASCTAIIVTGAATSAGANGSPAFRLRPAFGLQGSIITLTMAGAFPSGADTVTIGGAASKTVKKVTAHKLTAVVPAGASTGPVDVSNGSTTLVGPTFTLQQATAAAASVSRARLTFTQPLTVTGVLRTMVGSNPVAGIHAVLQHRISGSKGWHHAKGTSARKTGSTGAVHWRLKPAGNGWFRVHFRPTHTFAGATTSGRDVRVKPRLKLHEMHTVPVLSDSTINGTIRPQVSGHVYLQKLVHGAWHRVGKALVEGGHYSFTISPSALGALRYRVVRKYDGIHAATATHPLRLHVVNRELVLGDSGPDVKTLQKRLRKLHYDIGSVNGDYGDDTLHAVTAFEKVQGITPDGEVSTKVWSKLNHPKRIHLKHPNSGAYEVEVNIAKQVLLLGKGSHVVKILDTSTAGGYLYTNSEGGTSRAITPTGHFSIQYKLTGTRVSKLGTLYYPSYFTTTGYAIHGEGNGNDGGEVPPFPNSHGCVRITDNAVLRYFSTPWLAVGTSVWIYG